MKPPLHVLIVEDSMEDAKLLLRAISRADWTITHTRVETADQMRAALGQAEWDVVLCDYALPHFNGEAALQLLKETGLDIPFIFVSGTIGEDIAVAAMKTGAHDYVMKGNLARLVPAIARELREAANRQGRRAAEAQLHLSENKYRHLFQSMSDAALLVAEETGKIIDVNGRAEILFGRTRDEFLGLPVALLHPSLPAAFGPDMPGGGETAVQHKDGKLIPVHLGVTRVQLNTHPLQLLLFRDITVLKETERQLRTLSEHSPDIITRFDQEFRCLYANRSMGALTGVTAEEFIGGGNGDPIGRAPRVEPKSIKAIRAAITRVFATNTPVDIEIHVGSPAGESDHDVRFLPECDADGQVASVLCLARDITETKRAKAALQASEERLSTIFRLSPTPICIVRAADNAFVDANDAFILGTGYTRDEIIGHTPEELRLWEDPAERTAIRDAVLATGTAISMKLKGRRKSGEIGTGLMSMTRIVLKGEVHLLSLIQDITELDRAEEARRESEHRLRQISENIDEVFWLTDLAKSEMIYISPAYERIWGRTCESLYAQPQSWADAIHAEDRSRVLNAAFTLQAAGEYNIEYRIVRPDGSLRWIHDRAFPINDEGGRVYRIAGVAEDITARHQLEDQLREAQKMESLGTLAGGIAHDFNNILTGVLGSAELARLELPAEHPVAPWLNNIAVAGNRARDLVRQILTFGRKHESEMAPRELQCVVGEALRLLRTTIPSMVQIDSNVDAACAPVFADDTQIHQVVMNLCTNAWHALPENGGRIEVALKPVAVTADMASSRLGLTIGPYVLLTVRDNGRGMPPAVLARIFEPFFTTKKRGQGTGLGLAVVHGIIRSHQGAIFAHSTPGKGTTFEVFLPALDNPGGDLPPDEEEALPRGRGEHILLVDDDSTALSGLRDQLEHLGYRVTAVSDPRLALDQFLVKPEWFSLMLTDYAMPDISGNDLAAKVLSVRPDFPVILSSGYIETKQVQRIRSLGVREVFRKPGSLPDLARLIARHLPPR